MNSRQKNSMALFGGNWVKHMKHKVAIGLTFWEVFQIGLSSLAKTSEIFDTFFDLFHWNLMAPVSKMFRTTILGSSSAGAEQTLGSLPLHLHPLSWFPYFPEALIS
jgi:hypothetical protein